MGQTGVDVTGKQVFASTLKHVELAFMTTDQCAFQYASNSNRTTPVLFDDSMLCAWDKGQGACNGDEGGPLFDLTAKVLVGVTNLVPDPVVGTPDVHDCVPNAVNGGNVLPSVYTKIAEKWTWIKGTICADHSDPKPNFCPTPTAKPVSMPSYSTGMKSPKVPKVTVVINSPTTVPITQPAPTESNTVPSQISAIHNSAALSSSISLNFLTHLIAGLTFCFTLNVL